MLKPIEIEYLDDKYEILGIGAIMSVQRGKGYGKILMKEILKYLKTNKKTGLGFCARKNAQFYEKCGFNMVNDMALRFRYKYATAEEEQAELDDGGDGICYNGEDNFIRRIITTKELIYIKIPFW